MDPLGGELTFRRLTADDLPRMHGWLNAPYVARWWGAPPTLEQVAAKYAPRLDGSEPTDGYLGLLDGHPVAYLQTYLIRDYPEYATVVAAGDGAAGLDLFVGEPELIGRGFGPRLIRAFLDRVLFARPEVDRCVIGPAVSNAAAIRAYKKAGFVRWRTVEVPGEAEPELLLLAHRPTGPTSPAP